MLIRRQDLPHHENIFRLARRVKNHPEKLVETTDFTDDHGWPKYQSVKLHLAVNELESEFQTELFLDPCGSVQSVVKPVC